MRLSFSPSILLLLLSSQEAWSTSLSPRERGESDLENVGLAKLETNLFDSPPSQDVNDDANRKNDVFDLVEVHSPHRRLPELTWDKVATFAALETSINGADRVCISGDGTFLAVSPRYDDSFGVKGIVRFFKKRSDGSWKEQKSLRLLGDEAGFDYFGSDVSLSENGKRVAVGATGDDGLNDGAFLSGSVSVYEKKNGAWVLMGDVIHGEAKYDQSGSAVALSKDGSIVAIGAVFSNKSAGHVRVYQWNGSSFIQLGDDIDGDYDFDKLGNSVALSEDGLIVAIGASADFGGPGYVRVYEWKGNERNWVQRGSDIEGGADNDLFGHAVDLSGDGSILAVSAVDATNSVAVGAKSVNNNADETNGDSKVGEDSAPSATNRNGFSFFDDDFLGFDDDLVNNDFFQDDFLYDDDDNGNGGGIRGEVKVFEWKNDDWQQIGQTLEGFGSTVSLASSGCVLAVGSADTRTRPAVFKLEGDVWEELANDGADSSTRGPEVSLSSDGTTIAVGDPDATGEVNIYNLVGGTIEVASCQASVLTAGPTSGPTNEPTWQPTSEPTLRPTSGPTSVPTFDVSSEPTSAPTLAPSSGSNGDPHFRTWNGGHFEYHGQCDMVLVKDEGFADGLGLQVQIRTKLVRFWSFIQNAAIRIGDDTLEMQGSHDPFVNKGNNHYWINSVYQGKVATLGGFPVTATYEGKHKAKRWFVSKYGGGNKISRSFEIDLSSKYPGQKIVIGSYKEFVRVDFHNAESDAFGNSVGMLGNFSTGKTMARDGITELNDHTALGHEWQVLPQDGMLFHNVSDPQFPEQCIEPDSRAANRHRRLGESSITKEQAEAACASIMDVLDRKDCVSDVLATQDLTMIEAY